MGWGDEIMAAGHAAVEHRRTGRPVRILDVRGNPRWHPIWERYSHILPPSVGGGPFASVTNGPSCRPYIQYPFTAKGGMRTTGWRARDHRIPLPLTSLDRSTLGEARSALGRAYVTIEPHVSHNGSTNKDWGFGRFARLVEMLPHVRWVQMGLPGTRVLPGVAYWPTYDFLDTIGVLSGARAHVGVNGGLHHAAAELGVPGVILFGGFVDPEITGYPEHINLTGGADSFCGEYRPCDHCREAMDAITPADVAVALGRVAKQEVSA